MTQCSERIYGGYTVTGYPCSKPATVERNGKHWCTIHDPERVKQKAKERNERWAAKHNAEKAAREAAVQRQAEMERDAARYRWFRTHENWRDGGPYDALYGPDLDSAIDAAMAREAQK